jgi:hypothetical protein
MTKKETLELARLRERVALLEGLLNRWCSCTTLSAGGP